jgi:hypothetical protein
MNTTAWLCFVPLLIVLWQQSQDRKKYAAYMAARKKNGGKLMAAMVEAYIGKDCIVYTLNSQVRGIIKQVSDGWLLIDTGKCCDAINLEFIIRVREYPKNKKGKRATIFE